MSMTESAKISTDFRTVRPNQFPLTPVSAGSGSSSDPPMYSSTEDDGMLDQFSELFRISGIELSPEESGELKIFGQYLDRHVRFDGNCDVQCMLLWNEWVRVFRRQTSGFPALIREKEFRSVMTGKFGIGIADDGWRGLVYSGVRYVP